MKTINEMEFTAAEKYALQTGRRPTAAEMIYFAAVERDDFLPKTITAKFASQCVFCEAPVAIGGQVVCDPTFTPLGWAHKACHEAMIAFDESIPE